MELAKLAEPRRTPALDPDFRSAFSARRAFARRLEVARRSAALHFALERNDGRVSRFETRIFDERDAGAAFNFEFAEGLLKFLLWQRGARRVLVAGPPALSAWLAASYANSGARAFDAEFFSRVYAANFSVEPARLEQLPVAREAALRVGGNLDGCRIGFDAGGSDRKVCALIDGREVFSAEVPWQPKEHSDPEYHVSGIEASIASAARQLPRVDAIGVSSAGIYVENRTRVASLFRRVSAADFRARIENIYPDVARKFGDVPLAVANDGDVAALAGALALGEGPVLGLAFGTSLAAGYVDHERNLAGWLNELAFAPLDLAVGAPLDSEWSGDRGTAVHYLSQDAVVRLAPRANIVLTPGTRAEQLSEVQALAAAGDARARAVYASVGVYLGYALLGYTEFYALKHVLLLGRVVSGVGGELVLSAATDVLAAESPTALAELRLHLPGELQRRVGQAIAAASLPSLTRRE